MRFSRSPRRHRGSLPGNIATPALVLEHRKVMSGAVTVNSPPVITGFDGDVRYSPGSAIYVDSNVVLTDDEAGSYDGGLLTLEVTSGSDVNTVLSIRNAGNGSNQTSLNPANGEVRYSGVLVGTLTGGTGTTPLTVTWNSAANRLSVQGVMRNLTFQNVAPTIAVQTLRLTFRDGAAGIGETSVPVSKTVSAGPYVSQFSDTLHYNPGPAVYIDQDAQLLSAATNFDGGQLIVSFTNSFDANDILWVRTAGTGPGQFATSGSNLWYQGVTIGTIGFNQPGNPLQISFNANATRPIVQALIRNLTYRNTGPTAGQHGFRLVLTDGDGGSSGHVLKPINMLPIALGWSEAFRYTPGVTSYIQQDVYLLEGDSANYGGGEIRVDFSSGAEANNRLFIRTAGNGPGQFSVVGTVLRFSNSVIGSITGGTGTTPLVIALNSTVTTPIAQAILRNLTYSNTSPASGAHTMRLTISDGTGGTTSPLSKPVLINPVIGNFTDSLQYSRGTTVYLDQNATFSDPDTADYRSGQLRVDISAASAAHTLAVRSGGQFTVDPQTGAVRYGGGSSIGIVSGGVGTSPLVIDLNVLATPSMVQALIRNLTLRSTASVGSRFVVRVQLLDGQGGQSPLTAKTINVV